MEAETKRKAPPFEKTGASQRLSLRAIDDQLTAIADALIENGGELTEEMEAALGALEVEQERKAENIALLIRNLEAQAKVAAEEAKAVASIGETRASAAKKLRDYLHYEMARMGTVKTKTERVSMWRQINGRPSFTYSGDVAKLPDAFRKDPPPPPSVLDDAAALDAWRSEFDVLLGAELAAKKIHKNDAPAYKLTHRERLARAAAKKALPDGVTADLGEFLRIV